MKRILVFFTFLLTLLSFSNDKLIKIAAGGFPMNEIVNIAKEDLEKEGFKVEIKVLTDYVTANKGLLAKEFDANFHQHKPFMEIFNSRNNGNLVKISTIYDAYVGFYSKNIKNIKDLKDGANIAIPNDPTNKSRALKILENANLISLSKKEEGALYTAKDIIKNNKNLEIKEIGIPALGPAYDEFDLVFNWPAHVLRRGLTPKKDALILENVSKEQEFAIILAAREDNKNDIKIKALEKAMKSEKIKKFLNEKYQEQGYPTF